VSLPTLFDACVPKPDVLAGRVTESEFAADLAKVLNGSAGESYQDPVRFFANTYPTEGLRNLLWNVCNRLNGTGAQAASIFRLDTNFGGGKTHALIALTHAARGMPGVQNVREFVDPDLLPERRVRVAAFDGENADPFNGRLLEPGLRAYTPWAKLPTA
jgi:predicted AAA+ superfamily ATPase